MDWGFVDVVAENGEIIRAACFAMICHHCGQWFIEFFPNAKQENLFIGMLHISFPVLVQVALRHYIIITSVSLLKLAS